MIYGMTGQYAPSTIILTFHIDIIYMNTWEVNLDNNPDS